MDETTALRLLADLGDIPTAPLHERSVAEYVAQFIHDIGLPMQADPYGNLIATHRRGESARPIALVAHLDHPGLEISTVGPGNSAQAILLGGVPPTCFDRRVPVRIIQHSTSIKATIVGYDVNPQTGRVSSLTLDCQQPVRVGDF